MLQDLLDCIESTEEKDLGLYFISRKLKPNLKNKKKVLEKFDFIAYRVEINKEIRDYLYKLSKDQIQYSIKKNIELVEYDVIMDDSNYIYTYQMENKISSFMSVVNDQLPYKSTIRTIQNLAEIIQNEELWAYCVEFSYETEDSNKENIYTFRKLSSGKILVDENDNINEKYSKQIKALFNTKSNKLEILHGDTINLDKHIDCIYKGDTFYILHKKAFESMLGLEEDFKKEAKIAVTHLSETGKFTGIELISQEVENNTAIHKKLIKLKRLSNYSNISKAMIANMKRAGKKEKYLLKIDDNGCIAIEDKKDVDMIIKLLCDYYKEGIVTGKSYGTFSGRVFAEEN